MRVSGRRIGGDSYCWGTRSKKRRPPKRPPHLLKSVVALPPSIDVPRTIPIGLTDAALHRPTRSAAVPRAPSATIIVVIAVTVRISTDADVYARRVEVNALRFLVKAAIALSFISAAADRHGAA
jgi:hypothetical protein